MTIIAERIAGRLADLGHSADGQTWLAKLVGMRQQGIGAILEGRSERPRKLIEIARALQTTPEYLIGETDQIAPNELNYTHLPEDDPDWKPGPDDGFSAQAYNRENYKPEIPGALPELDVQPGAGEGRVGEVVSLQLGEETYSGHRVVAEWLLPPDYLRNEINVAPGNTIVMPVVGDSMVPTYNPGDRVLVDLTQNELNNDTVYVISDGQSPPQIKRLTRVLFTDPVEVNIISDNAAQGSQTGKLNQLTIIGRVCGVVAKR